MKVLFICGSMEPGKDGVGDYTRRLCGMLQLQGHEVAAMGFYDQHIDEEVVEAIQKSEGQQFEVIRLPSKWAGKRRFVKAREWIDQQNPDWLSLQFVLYSFQEKGLPLGLGETFSKLGKSRKWHVMFHELWIGMERQSTYKHRMIGLLQQRLIGRLIKTLNPQVIHTQTRFYRSLLLEKGWEAELLPLFSNIPFMPISQGQLDFESNNFILVLFGHINPGAPVAEFARELATLCERKNLKPRLVLIGRNGAGQYEWIKVFKKWGIKVQVFGEQEHQVISEVLQLGAAGITTTPGFLLEKSGTVAAMKLHGLPIIGVSKPWNPRKRSSVDPTEGYFEYKVGNLEEFLGQKKTGRGNNSIREVSKELSVSLTQHKMFLDKKNEIRIGACESAHFVS